jgi:hypothetical protein
MPVTICSNAPINLIYRCDKSFSNGSARLQTFMSDSLLALHANEVSDPNNKRVRDAL